MNGKILIVDDNAQSVSLMTLLLQHADGTVVSASCGAEGLKIARREPLDMILMDIQMPDMDGFRAAHEILADKNTRHIPVIGISAYASPQSIKQAMHMGMVGFIEKPIDHKQFIARVRAFLLPGTEK